MTTWTSAERSTAATTRPRVAPIAIRTPISRVRATTNWAVTPYRPRQASSNAIEPNATVSVATRRSALKLRATCSSRLTTRSTVNPGSRSASARRSTASMFGTGRPAYSSIDLA